FFGRPDLHGSGHDGSGEMLAIGVEGDVGHVLLVAGRLLAELLAGRGFTCLRLIISLRCQCPAGCVEPRTTPFAIPTSALNASRPPASFRISPSPFSYRLGVPHALLPGTIFSVRPHPRACSALGRTNARRAAHRLAQRWHRQVPRGRATLRVVH